LFREVFSRPRQEVRKLVRFDVCRVEASLEAERDRPGLLADKQPETRRQHMTEVTVIGSATVFATIPHSLRLVTAMPWYTSLFQWFSGYVCLQMRSAILAKY
jgi:hypothetical protein